MLHPDGSLSDVIELARTAVALRDRILSDADHDLNAALCDAGQVALTAVEKLDAMRAEIAAAVSMHALGIPLDGRQFARFLLARQHLIADIVMQSKSNVEAKTAVLQQLRFHYTFGE
jgi:hypothetical protein